MSDARENPESPLHRSISVERWRMLEPLIDELIALAPEQRPAFLESVCHGDASLRAELTALLEAYDRKDSLLDGPAAERFASLFTREPVRPPAVLGDRYRVERELGRGGTATVYLAHDIRHERNVAVKILHPELAAALGDERFLDEIRTTAQLHHPHILPLHDSGETDGMLYYVMPYVAGETLRRRLEREQQLPIEDAVRIACDVAGALDFAHRHGVIHRDVKPENILLHDGSALVADFGIALATRAAAPERGTAPGLIVGTPQYMSPEQATGDDPIDARTDVYALGAVLYEMLAGEAPFTSAQSAAIMARRSATPAPELRLLRTGVPDALEAAVSRALAREPSDRYSSAGEFADALEQALRPGEPEPALNVAGTSSPPSHPTSESPRRWGIATVLALAIPIIAAVMLLVRHNGRPVTPAETRQLVLVRVFENRTGDSTLDMIGIQVADLTSFVLGHTKLVDVVSPSFDMWNSENARPTRPVSVETLVRQTRATMIVRGAYHKEGDSLVFEFEGLDTRSRRTFGDSFKVSAWPPGEAVERVRQRVMSAIATRVDPALRTWAGNESAPPVRVDAYQEFAVGMTSFLQGIVSRRGSSPFLSHYASAQMHLERAFRLDSTYYIPALWWVFSRLNVGDTRGADSLIQALEQRRASMFPYEQTLYDYVVAFANGTPEQRYQLDRRLVLFGPASEYRYCLVRDAVEAGHPREALKESETLDDSYSWMRLLRSLPSFRVRALAQLGQLEDAIAIAVRAEKDSPVNLSSVYPHIDALAAAQRLDEIEPLVSRFSTATGVSNADAANLMLYAGLRLQSAGRRKAARRFFGEALKAYTNESPDAAAPEVILFGKARSLYYLERWDEARARFNTLARPRPGTSRYDRQAVAYLGSLAAIRRDTAEISRLRSRLAKSFPKSGEAQYFDAHVAALLKQPDRALAFLNNAMELGAKTFAVLEEFDATPSMDPDFAGLRKLPRFQSIVAFW